MSSLTTWWLSIASCLLAACGRGDAVRTERDVVAGIAEIVAGEAFTCRRAGGRVTCCGNGWHGELGNGASEDEGSAVAVRDLDDATAMVAGGFHACAIRRDGSVWCWGENRWGQLGSDAVGDHRAVAGVVPGVAHATQLAAGILHTCVVTAGGTAWCWGRNQRGQTGNGGTSEIAAPALVAGLDGVTAVAVGGFHTCARRNDGGVVCWGENDRGQLGDATSTPRTAPVPVAGLTGVVELAAGSSHSCARLADRTVQCWGSNEVGQLAEPGASARSTPGRVPGVTDAVAIRAHNDETCVLSGDGRVTCWGAGLGPLGGKKDQRAPWLVLDPAERARTFALGGEHLCIATAGDALICRGAGRHGQLCDGSSPPRSSTFPPPP